MKSANNALSPGDICYFKRGDKWVGTNAEIVVNSNGTPLSYITLDAYGTGDDPMFTGAAPTTSGWVYTGANSIYTLGGQSQTHLKVVTQGETKALGRWQGTVTTLPEGTFRRSGTTLYVRLWGNVDPSTADVRVASYAHSSSVDGARGLVGTSRTSTLGDYISFKNLKVLCANGVGMSSSGKDVRFYNCRVCGSGNDGVIFYSELTGSGEDADGTRWYEGEISYCAASGTGYGQGFTGYAIRGWVIDCNIENGGGIHDNFMAGVDYLFAHNNHNPNYCGILRCDIFNNGRWQDSISYDPQAYISDGAHDIFMYGCRVWGWGVQSGATNSKVGIQFGSERPTTRPCYNISVIGCLAFGGHGPGIKSNQVCYGSTTECPPSGTTAPNNMLNVNVVNNTFAGIDAVTSVPSEDRVISVSFAERTEANNWNWKNNIFICDATSVNDFMLTGTWLDLDYNLYYRRGQSSSATIFKVSGTSYTMATWKSFSGKDANSAYGNPLVTLDSDTLFDAHLSPSSPAINAGLADAFTPPDWLPEDLFPYGGVVRGTTQVDGTIDEIASHIDLGYHYNSDYVEDGGGGPVLPTPILLISGLGVSGVTIG